MTEQGGNSRCQPFPPNEELLGWAVLALELPLGWWRLSGTHCGLTAPCPILLFLSFFLFYELPPNKTCPCLTSPQGLLLFREATCNTLYDFELEKEFFPLLAQEFYNVSPTYLCLELLTVLWYGLSTIPRSLEF